MYVKSRNTNVRECVVVCREVVERRNSSSYLHTRGTFLLNGRWVLTWVSPLKGPNTFTNLRMFQLF